MADVISKFNLRGDQPWIGKDPSSGLIYGVDMKPWLATNPGVTLDEVVVRVFEGVTVGVPFIQDDVLCVMVSGLDVAEEAENFVTFHFTCADGQHDDRTIYFFQQEH